MSCSVCALVEHQSLDCLFTRLYNNLVMFNDDGPTFYDTATLIPESIQMILPWQDMERMVNNSTSNLLRYSTASRICDIHYLRSHVLHYECLSTYLHLKATELNAENHCNRFTCPLLECRRGRKIVSCVKQYFDEAVMDKVWV